MDDLEATIKRLEDSTEGSRELDEEILAEVDHEQYARYMANAQLMIAEVTERGMPERADSARRSAFYGTPHYTTSLDAALTLVPEGHEWHNMERNVQWDDPEVFAGQEREYGVQIYGMTEAGYPDFKRDFIGAHDLLPIALCIAALRSRSLHTEGGK